MPIRVLFVESGTEIGGAQQALLTMLRHLDRSRILPFYASLGFGDGDLPEIVERMKISVRRLPPGRFRSLPTTVRKIRELVNIIRREQIDLVFSNSGHPLLYARPAALLTQRQCIWWVHGYLEQDALKGHMVPLVEQILQCDHLLANSRFTAGVLARVFPSRSQVPVVYYGVEIDRHTPSHAIASRVRRQLGIPAEDGVVGMFGRLQPFKGQHIFLDAAKLLKDGGIRPHLLFIGGSPFGLSLEYAEYLQQYSMQLGLGSQVHFLGQRSDTHELLQACDVVVHASIEPEPWGLVVAEGMAAGRAVVASRAGGPLEMIEHGRTGWLAAPGDAEDFAASLAILLADPNLRKRLGDAARQFAVEHFDAPAAADRFTKQLVEIYKKHKTGSLN